MMMMRSHLWLSLAAIVIFSIAVYAETKMPLADDPIFNKIISTTEESNKSIFGSRKPVRKTSIADDPRFNKMLPSKNLEKEAAMLKTSDAIDIMHLPLLKDGRSKTKVTDLDDNSIINSSKTDDDYYSDYDNYYDYDDVVNATDTVTTTSEAAVKFSKKMKNTPEPFEPIVRSKVDTSKLKLISDVDEDLDSDENDNSDDDDDEDDDSDDEGDDSSDLKTERIVCPRDCVCSRNINGFMVATCNLLDAGVQRFSSGITDLEVVSVTQRYPIVLGAGFFKNIGLKDVSSIKIANAFIENIHPKAFEGLNDLYLVNLTNSGITVLHPDTFAENKKLRILTLDDNDLSQMQINEDPFNRYMLKAPSVEELSLSRCNLRKILPTAFSRLENIVYINLANNNLQSMPANIFDQVATIEELDLSSNNITNLPKNIFNRTSLAILNLKYNHIESKLDFATSDIQKLDLSFNNISNIGSNMFDKMTGLTSLILKGNGIKKIHSTAFFSLNSLRQIDLSFNDLEQVSGSLFLGNKDLDIIRLNDNNRLKSLPLEGFASETGRFNVYLFDLQNCDISELGDDTFKYMPRMTTLNLAWNNIGSLSPDFFKSMTKLIELNLSNNEISELDNLTFLYNRNLKKLNLAGNPLTNISPRIFLPLKNLTELDISNCDLTEIWSEPMSSNLALSTILKNVKLLNVSNNNIIHARHTHFSTMEKLEVLDMSKNHLHCDDGFKSLMKWLKERKIKAGSINVGFNAKLIDGDIVEDSPASYSLGWDSFENRTCSAHPAAVADSSKKTEEYSGETADSIPSDEDLDDDENDMDGLGNGKLIPVDSVDGDESDSEDDDDEDAEEYDDEAEIEIKGGNELRDPTSKNILDEKIDGLSDRIGDLENEVIDSHDVKILAYNLFPIVFGLFGVIVLLAIMTRMVSMMVHRRGESYRQALLASKNSFIYQKLSEEINTPQTPKLHRYAPINQV